MEWWEAAAWGMAGGLTIELVDLYKMIRTADPPHYGLPEGGKQFWLAYTIAVGIRLIVGGVSAWALQAADQLDSAIAALAVGTGATGLLEHVSRRPRTAGGPSASDEAS